MSVESAADRLAFFDTDEHAADAAFAPAAGASRTVPGIFDNEYVTVFDGQDASVESSGPAFICRTVDIPGAAHGDTLTLSGVAYIIRGVQPDGTGITTLRLEAP